MNLVWTWWGVPGTFAFVAAWCCAIVALRTNPRRILNQHLTLILILEGVYVAGIAGLLFFFDDPTIVTTLATVGTAAMVAVPFAYLSFLAVSLHTPLVAPFRSRAARVLFSPHKYRGRDIRISESPLVLPGALQTRLGSLEFSVHGVWSAVGAIARVCVSVRTDCRSYCLFQRSKGLCRT